jgi:hypothetical protein
MSAENVKRFMQRVVQDRELQQELSKTGIDVAKIISRGRTLQESGAGPWGVRPQ